MMFVYAEVPDAEKAVFAPLGDDWKSFYPGAHDQSAQGIVLTTENFRVMHNIRPSLGSLNDAFDLILKHMNASHTFALAQLSQRRLLFHLPGGELGDWCHQPTENTILASTAALSAARIEADVQQWHDNNLLYATNPISHHIWVGKHEPYKLQVNPEQRIQSYLHLYLHASYQHLQGLVDEEVRGKGGRSDIRLTWRSPIGSTHDYTTTFLELKVLAEGAGPKFHRRWTISGIEQAEKYRRENSEAVYACIFDARKDQTDQMLDLDQVAIDKNVRLKRYLMEAPIDATAAGKAAKKATKKTLKKGTKKAAKSAQYAIKSSSKPIKKTAKTLVK